MDEILGLVRLPGQQQRLFLLPQDPNQLHVVTCLGGCEAKAETPCASPVSLGCAQQHWGPARRGGCVSTHVQVFQKCRSLCRDRKIKSVGGMRSEQQALDKTQMMHFPTVLPNPVIWWQF